MRNFLQVADRIDVMPILHAVQRQSDLWNQNKVRTTHQHSPHAEVDDIWLRFNDMKPYEAAAEAAGAHIEDPSYTAKIAGVLDEHESICYPAWYRLPQAHEVIFNLMRRVDGVRLGRVLITRLRPGGKIYPHSDGGSHAEYYERYHIPLQNMPGSIFRAGDETVQMNPGECWWFNNAAEHEVTNNSADDRIVMIIDIRCVK